MAAELAGTTSGDALGLTGPSAADAAGSIKVMQRGITMSSFVPRHHWTRYNPFTPAESSAGQAGTASTVRESVEVEFSDRGSPVAPLTEPDLWIVRVDPTLECVGSSAAELKWIGSTVQQWCRSAPKHPKDS